MCPWVALAKKAASIASGFIPASAIASDTDILVNDLTSESGQRPNRVIPIPMMNISCTCRPLLEGISEAPLLPLPEVVLDVSLGDFAHGSPREPVPEQYRFGRLDRSEPTFAHRNDLRLRRVKSGSQLYHGGHGLSPLVVGETDNRAVLHRRMGPDDLFNLRRIDVVAARDDHVAGAVDQVIVAIGIAIAEVTGVMPTIPASLRRGTLVLVIALHHITRAYDDFANISVSTEAAVLSHHGKTHKGRRPSAACQPIVRSDPATHEMIFGSQNRAKHQRLDLPESLDEDGTEYCQCLAQLGGRHRRGPIEQILQTRKARSTHFIIGQHHVDRSGR